MKNYIFYLTKPSFSIEKGLIFPSELEDENYYGIGNFYILNKYNKELKYEYIIPAVHNNEILNLTMKKNENSKKFYTCFVNEIGNFIFYAEKLKNDLPYVGRFKEYKDFVFSHRLRLWNIQNAERSVINHNFYFVGYTNIVNG